MLTVLKQDLLPLKLLLNQDAKEMEKGKHLVSGLYRRMHTGITLFLGWMEQQILYTISYLHLLGSGTSTRKPQGYMKLHAKMYILVSPLLNF